MDQLVCFIVAVNDDCYDALCTGNDRKSLEGMAAISGKSLCLIVKKSELLPYALYLVPAAVDLSLEIYDDPCLYQDMKKLFWWKELENRKQ